MEIAKVYNAADQIEAARILSFLKEEGIPCYSAGADVGEYMEISQGFSMYGRDIMVDRQDAERAKEIISELLSETESEENEDIEAVRIPWYRSRAVVARIILICGIGSMIFWGIWSWI